VYKYSKDKRFVAAGQVSFMTGWVQGFSIVRWSGTWIVLTKKVSVEEKNITRAEFDTLFDRFIDLPLEESHKKPSQPVTEAWTRRLRAAIDSSEGAYGDLIDQIAASGANAKNKDGGTLLSLAAGYGDRAIVKLLLERGDIEADSRDENGWMPLACAARSGHVSVVKMLLARSNVNVHSTDDAGRTPLYHAARFGKTETVKLLLARGNANVHYVDRWGDTPLKVVERSGNREVVRLLQNAKP